MFQAASTSDDEASAPDEDPGQPCYILALRKLAYGGEANCCSGICALPPCVNPYGPKKFRCCGLVPPRYAETAYSPNEFFELVMPCLSTGDLFYWSYPCEENGGGEGLQRCCSQTRWTHIGFIYRPADSRILQHHRTHECQEHELEPTRPQIMHMLIGCKLDGFNLTDFEEEAKNLLNTADANPDWEYMIAVRFLEGVRKDDAFYQTVENTIREYWNTEYDMDDIRKSALDLCDMCGDCLQKASDDDTHMFCSEMVAKVYQELGLLDKHLLAAEFTPGNFDSASSLPLLKGAKLSEEHVVRAGGKRADYDDDDASSLYQAPRYSVGIPMKAPNPMTMS